MSDEFEEMTGQTEDIPVEKDFQDESAEPYDTEISEEFVPEDEDVEIPEMTEPSGKKKKCNEQPEEGCCYRLKVVHSNETHLCRAEDCSLERDDLVIMQSKYGKDLARVTGRVMDQAAFSEEEMTELGGKADEKDLKKYEENREKAAEAMRICKEKIDAHNLDMKLVSAHYLDDNTKVLFFFTAEARVDFRALVKDLVAIFKMRIELRQIGVRDESRVLGGLAVCGRNYCCAGLTDRLRPVSIKMAKEQNLSLNSMKISGPCGRLLCCLSYEYDFYREEKRKLPGEGNRIAVGKEMFRVSEVNIQSKKIILSGEDGRKVEVSADRFYRDSDNEPWRLKGGLED